ncbi:uncharacterized protein DUF1573 [Prosthecobacter fusiformis]|uniref:Uncharacterized protein DUF1573 n=1 Tax=Prosthecobacter fusiformis TaxID=48464 RepID=A0A4R7RJP8_9BACT|nr:uncharacterized protein DUF1573 [Prosthecobacter fusiformis]
MGIVITCLMMWENADKPTLSGGISGSVTSDLPPVHMASGEVKRQEQEPANLSRKNHLPQRPGEKLNIGERRLLENAVMLNQAVYPADATGLSREVRLWRTAFKYPLVREEVWLKDAAGEAGIIRREFSVADHVMVKFPVGLPERMINEWADKHGFYVRHSLKTSPIKLIATPAVSLDAAQAIVAAFNADFPEAAEVTVATAEPDYLIFPSLATDDENFNSLWGLHNVGQTGGKTDADIDALEAWDYTTGSREVLVAVIDTGIDRTHPDLAANIWTNQGEIPGNGIDDDLNGFVDDVHGWDFFANDNDSMDSEGHGTHCAGTIGAAGNNRIGVTGVCWQVSMVGIRFLGPDGGATSDGIESIYYATSLGVDMTSNSWGGSGYSALLKQAIDDSGEHDILFTAAAGNDATSNEIYPHYPSDFTSENIISVASSTASDARSSFSNYGKVSVDLAAPGTSIFSTIPGSAYGSKSGTSMATPHVTGALALAKSIAPMIGAAELKQKLLATVDAVPALESTSLSGGRLNALKLVQSFAGPYPVVAVSRVTEHSGGNGDGIQNPGEFLSVEFTVTNRGTETATHLVATLSSKAAAGASHYNIIEENVPVGTLAAGETSATTSRFVVMAHENVPTPDTEEMMITLSYGDPQQTRVQSVNLQLFTSSQVAGRVTDAKDGSGLAQATVSMDGPSVVSVSTNEDGYYTATLIDGVYQTSALAPGYLPSPPQEVTAPPGRDDLHFVMAKPQLRLSPEAISVQANSEEVVQRDVMLTNDGTAPLEWSIRPLKVNQQTISTVLPSVQAGASNDPDVSEISPQPQAEIPELILPLNELNGVKVAAVYSTQSRSIFLGDLRERGATVVTLYPPFTELDMQDIDAVIVDDSITALSTADIQLLRAAIHEGTGLLCEADNSESLVKVNQLLADTGITPRYQGFRNLILSDFVLHPITSGLVSLHETSVGCTADISGPAQPLVREADEKVHAAVSRLGKGAVVFVGNEITYATNFSVGDGRRFANQIVDSLVAGPEWLTVTPLAGVLAAGEETTVSLGMDARTVWPGQHDANLELSSNIPGEPDIMVPVTFEVIKMPDIQVNQPSFDFGQAIIGTTVTREMVITNAGSGDLELKAPSLSGPHAQWFSLSLTDGVVIEPGGHLSLTVTYLPGAPVAAAAHTALINLASNDAESPLLQVPLYGRHLAAPNIGIAPLRTVLQLAQGQTATRTLTVKNTGKGVLNMSASLIFASSAPTDWVEIESGSTMTIAAGKSAKIIVRFHARTYLASSFAAVLRVLSEDPDTPVYNCDLLLTTTSAPVADFAPLNFDKTYVGVPQSGSVTLRNTGSVDMVVRGVRGLSSVFRSTMKVPFTIPPQGGVTIPVTFSPAKSAVYKSSLLVTANVPGKYVYVPLTGIGERYPAISVSPKSLTVSSSPGVPQSRVLQVTNLGGESLIWSVEPVSTDAEWLIPQTSSNSLTTGKKGQVNLSLASAQKNPGTYKSSLRIISNDPKIPVATVPITFNVSSQAVVQTVPSALDLGDIWKSQVTHLHFDLTNVGNLPLEIRTVSSNTKDMIFPLFGKVTLAPGESLPLRGTLQPTKLKAFKGVLTVKTSSRVNPTVSLRVSANVINPPTMLVAPGSLVETVQPNVMLEKNITISNQGDADLQWQSEVVAQIDSPDSAGTLDEILQRLDARHADFTQLIRNRYNFSDGTSGYSISNGGLNMYNAGNLFSTNHNGGSAVAYSDGNITADVGLGASSRYFTRKKPGLFVMAANLAGATTFRIRGGLGASGAGTATGSVLHRYGYTGFFKQVTGARIGVPSVFHLIVMPDHEGLTRTFSTNTSLDDHEITGLPASTRVYALVFAATSGTVLTESEIRLLMDKFVTGILHNADTRWLRMSANEGAVKPKGTSSLTLSLDARNMEAGSYAAKLRISGNAPDTPTLDVPITFNVPSAAVLVATPSSIAMPDTPANGTTTQTVTLRNEGNLALRILGLETSDPAFAFSYEFSMPHLLKPGESLAVNVKFTPTDAISYSGVFKVLSAADAPMETSIPLTGTGLIAPLLTLDPTMVGITTRPGVPASKVITLSNTGTATLDWRLGATPTTGILSHVAGSIPAGGSQEITLTTLSTATTSPGASVQSISFVSNDPVRPIVGLTYTRNIQAEPILTVTPSPVDFNTVRLPGLVTRQIVLRNSGNANLIISGVTSPSPHLTLLSTTYPAVILRGASHTVTLQYAPTAPEILSGSFIFTTNNLYAPTVEVPLSGEAGYPPLLAVSPGAVNVSLEEGQTVSSTLEVRNEGGSLLSWNVSITPASAKSWLTLTKTAGGTPAGGVSQFEMNLSAARLPPSTVSATLIISSNAAVNATASIPVSLQVTPGEFSVSSSSLVTSTVAGAPAPNSSFSIIPRPGHTPSWTVSSDVPWIIPSSTSGTGAGEITLSYLGSLPEGTHTGQVTVSTASLTRVIQVTCHVLKLQLSLLQTDRRHDCLLGLVRGTAGASSFLIALNPDTLGVENLVQLPTDISSMDMTTDERTLYAISFAGQSISRVNLDDFSLVATRSIPATTKVGSHVYVQAGREGRVYYTDASANPALHSFDFEAGADIESFRLTGLIGIGGFVVSPDARRIYARSLTAWTGLGTAYLAQLDCSNDVLSQVASSGATLVRDGSPHPVLLGANVDSVITQGKFFTLGSLGNGVQGSLTSSHIYTASAYLDVVVTDSQIIRTDGLDVVGNLPVTTTITAFSPDQSQLIYQDPVTGLLGSIDTSYLPSIAVTPGVESGSVQNSNFNTLTWSGDPSASTYDIYLGTDEAAVEAASNPTSSLFQASTPGTGFALYTPLVQGQTYYWRIDSRAPDNTVSSSPVWSFKMAAAGTDPDSISGYAMPGSTAVQEFPLSVVTASANVPWSLTSDSAWVNVSSAAGTGPAEVIVTLVPSSLAPGATHAELTLTSGADVIRIPVRFDVMSELNIIKMQADPALPVVHALHRETTAPYLSWLLWVDPATATVLDGVMVGPAAMDFASHSADDKIDVLVDDGRRVQRVARQGNHALLSSYDLSELQTAIHASSVGRVVTRSAANTLQLRFSSNGSAIGSAVQLLGLQSLTVSSTDGGSIYAAVTQSSTNVGLVRYAVTGSGVTPVTSLYFAGTLQAPLLLSASQDKLIYGQKAYNPDQLNSSTSLGQRVYAISPDAARFVSSSTVFSLADPATPLATLPVTTTQMTITFDGQKLLLFSPVNRAFHSVDMP